MRYMGRCYPEVGRQTSLAAAVPSGGGRACFGVQSGEIVAEAAAAPRRATRAGVAGRGVPPAHREDLPAGAQRAEAEAKAAWSK
jgi:hypothetical protein